MQRLVVRGPFPDVAAFMNAAVCPKAAISLTVDDGERTQKLSFGQLRAALPVRLARRVPGKLEEPWDLIIDPVKRRRDGMVEVTYKFQLSRSEPDALILAVSMLYPRLCFVVGCVALDVDEQSSRFVHNGRSWRWHIPATRTEAILARVPEETAENADEVLWAEAEAGWAMMDEVVAHWKPKADVLMASLLKRDPRRPGLPG